MGVGSNGAGRYLLRNLGSQVSSSAVVEARVGTRRCSVGRLRILRGDKAQRSLDLAGMRRAGIRPSMLVRSGFSLRITCFHSDVC